MALPHWLTETDEVLRAGAHRTGALAQAVYEKSGLGSVGHALNESAVAVARAPADLIGGVKGAYGATGSKLQGGADNVGQIAVGAASTTGAAVRDFTQPIGAGVGAIGQGVGDLASGAGGGLKSTGDGVGSFGKYAGIGLGALALVLVVVVVFVFAKKGARGVAA